MVECLYNTVDRRNRRGILREIEVENVSLNFETTFTVLRREYFTIFLIKNLL